MTLGLRDLRHLAYDDPVIGPALGFYGTATSVTALSLTDPDNFGRTNYGSNHFAGRGVIVLPNRDGTDREKVVGRISGDTVTLDDAVNYTQTYTNEPYEFIQGGTGPEKITIARLNSAAQDALRMVYFDTRDALSQLFADGGMNSAGIGSWVPSGTVGTDITLEKSLLPEHNLPGGLYSLLVGYITANQYISAAQAYGAQAGDQLYIAALPIILTAGGTATLKLWDETNDVQIGQTLTVTGRGAYHLSSVFSVPNAAEVNVRLGGSAGISVAWDSMPNHDIAGLSFAPPDWVDAGWKLHGIDEITYSHGIASEGAARAASAYPQRWQPRIDYALTNMNEDANPGLIQVMRSVHSRLPTHDLFFYGQRRESDRSALESEAQVTNADRDYLVAAFFSILCDMLEARDRLGPQGTWRTEQRDYDLTVAAQRVMRVQAAPQPRMVRRVSVI